MRPGVAIERPGFSALPGARPFQAPGDRLSKGVQLQPRQILGQGFESSRARLQKARATARPAAIERLVKTRGNLYESLKELADRSLFP